jgi:DNA helicase II / ATP-dependent DNA helicase PcrA
MSDLVQRISELLRISPNDEQRQIIESPPEPAVVIAGAGSGKTTVMAARVLWLVGSGFVRPGEVLGLTFTNKAASEFLARVRTNLTLAQSLGGPFSAQEDDTDPAVGTYHSFARRLLVDHGLRIGVEPDASLLSEGALRRIAYRTVVTTRLTLLHTTSRPIELAKSVINLDKAMVEQCIDPDALFNADQDLIDRLPLLKNQQAISREIIATAHCRQELVQLVQEFRAAKATAGGRDFTDQMRLVGQLAADRPEVGEQLRQAFRVVLLDEYQDTSIAQRTFLHHFFGDGHPVTAVGDPFQAIYGWRGASVHNITEFSRHFATTTQAGTLRTPVYQLSVNYRSSARILDGANAVAAELRAEHTEVAGLRPGSRVRHDQWRLALHQTKQDETIWAAEQTARVWSMLLEQERNGEREAPDPKERAQRMAVLCRDGTGMLAMSIELDRLGVPYEVVGVEGLLAQPVVNDVLSYLRVAHDPTANAAMIRLLTGPRWNIGPRDLALLGRRAMALTETARSRIESEDPAVALDAATVGTDVADVVALVDAVDDPGELVYSPEARERFTQLSEQLREVRQHAGDPLDDLISRVLRITGLDVEMRIGEPMIGERATAAVGQLMDLATEGMSGAAGPGAQAETYGLGAFLTYVDDLQRFGGEPIAERPSAVDAVRLMTVHAAKGLEFIAVVLPFLVDGVFPTGKSRPVWFSTPSVVPPRITGDPLSPIIDAFPNMVEGPRSKDVAEFTQEWRRLDLLEERRLAYVAVTRAKEILIASGHYWGPTQKARFEPADYLLRLKEYAADDEVDVWCEPEVTINPNLAVAAQPVAWPRERNADATQRRRAAAQQVTAAMRGDSDDSSSSLTEHERELIASWDADLHVLMSELDRVGEPRVVRLPASLTTSALMDLAQDPVVFAERIARPMPRLASPAADRGTAFHAWVEARWGAQVPVLTDDDLEGAADDVLFDEDLLSLKEAFESGPFADDRPAQVEVPFSLVLAGRPVRGRIDAIFARGNRWLVIDWKTSSRDIADPLQLAVYRLAWAEIVGCDVDLVDAAFHFVRSGTTTTHDDLPDRSALEALLTS